MRFPSQTIKSVLLLLLAAAAPFLLPAQNIKKSFIREFFNDDFADNHSHWTALNTRENLFLVQDGAYTLWRKNDKAPYLIYNELFGEQETCSLLLSCVLNKENTANSYIGLVFLVQSDKKGAFIVDLSIDKRYRIRQLAGAGFQYLTGDEKQEGWAKLSDLHSVGEENTLKVNISQNTADIYINNQYLTTITNPSYKSGKCGIVVGPATKALVRGVKVLLP